MKPACRLDDPSLELSAEDCLHLRQLVRLWRDRAPVLVVGAGLTTYNVVPREGKSGRPADWSALQRSFRQALVAAGHPEGALPTDALRLAELYRHLCGREDLVRLIASEVREFHFDPSAVHRILARQPWEAVITLNYDSFLERSYAEIGVRACRIVWDADLTRHRERGDALLLKLHGSFEDSRSIVISEDDYRRYDSTRGGLLVKAKQLLWEHPLLIVGFSLSDPNVERLLGWVRDTSGTLALPAVSIVHSTPGAAERQLWVERGIRLVRCGNSLLELMRSVEREREELLLPSRRTDAPGRSTGSLSASPAACDPPEKRVHDAFQRDPTSAVEVARTELLSLARAVASSGSEAQMKQAAMSFRSIWIPLMTSWGRLAQVMLSCSPPELSSVLQVALECNFAVVSQIGGGQINIAAALLCFGALSTQQKVSVARRWISNNLEDIDGCRACADVLSRHRDDPELSADLKIDVAAAFRDIAFKRVDAEALRDVANAPTGTDASSLCRIACDSILLGDVDRASRTYREAYARANRLEERITSAQGVLHVENRSLDRFRRDDPLADELHRLHNIWKHGPIDALSQLGRAEERHKEALRKLARSNSEFDIVDGAGTLFEYAMMLRNLGVPHGVPGIVNEIDQAVTTASVRLLESRASHSDRLLAVKELIRFGVTPNGDITRLIRALISRCSAPDDRAAIRSIALDDTRAWPVATYLRNHVALLAADLLSDEELERAVDICVSDAGNAGSSPELRRRVLLEARWEALSSIAERLSPRAAIRVAELSIQALEWRWFDALDAVHLGLLPRASIRASVALQTLAEKVVNLMSKESIADDWFAERKLRSVLIRLHSGGVLDEDVRSRCRAALLEQVRRAKDDTRVYKAAEVAATLLSLGFVQELIEHGLVKVLLDALPTLLRSSHAANGLYVLGQLAGRLSEAEVRSALGALLEAKTDHHSRVREMPHQEIAETIARLAVFAKVDVLESLRSHARHDVRAAPALAFAAAQAAPDDFSLAVHLVATQAARGFDLRDDDILADTLEAWLRLHGDLPRMLEPYLFARMVQGNSEVRFQLLRAIRDVSDKWRPSDPRNMFELMKDLAKLSEPATLRAIACLSVESVGESLQRTDETRAILSTALSDRDTLVRRAAAFALDRSP